MIIKLSVFVLTLFNSLFLFAFTTEAATSTGIIGNSSLTGTTQASTMRKIIRTSDGTLHAFLSLGTQTATCAGQAKSALVWFNSTDGGSTWTCQAQLNTNSNYTVSATVDSSDNIYLVYSTLSTGGGTTLDIFYRKLTKGSGASWTLETEQTALDSSSASTGYAYATIELQGATRAWVALRYFDGTNYQVRVYYSDSLGTAPTWTESSSNLDSADTSASQHFPVVVRFGSKIGVIYNRGGNPPIRFRFRNDSDGLNTWSGESNFGQSSLGVATLAAQGDSNGNILVVTNPTTALYLHYYNGVTWSTRAQASSTAANAQFSSLSTDGVNAWLIFGDTTGFSSGLTNLAVSKMSYVKCAPPYAAENCDSSATPLVSYHGAFDKVWSFNGGTSTYTDETTDSGNSTSADVTMVSSVNGAGTTDDDAIYFGKSEKFDSLTWDVSTAGNSGGALAWEYCSAVDVNTACSTWSSLTLSSQTSAAASEFEADGYGAFADPANWAQAKVNSESTAYYYIRARVTTSYTTAPVGVQIVAIPPVRWGSVTNPASGNVYMIWTENTVSPTRARFTSFSVSASTPNSASSSELSPQVVAYSALGTATQVSTQRHLVRTSDGTLHAFVQAGRQLACGTSAGSANTLGLVWVYSTDSGATWSCGGQLSSDGTNPMYASATVDSSDNIYLVYSVAANNRSTSFDVLYRKLTYNGASSWTLGSEQTVLDSTSSNTGYSYAVIEAQGTTRLWIVGRLSDSTSGTALYSTIAYYSDGLGSAPTWSQSIAAMQSAGSASANNYPAVVRFGSKIGVVYLDNSSGNLKWRYRSDNDALTNWEAEDQVGGSSFGSGNVAAFSAVVDNSNNIHVVSNASTVVRHTYYNGSVWSSVVTVSSAAAATAFSSVSTDGSNIYILYGETTGLASGLSGSRKLVYKKGISPFTSSDFDSTATQVISRHGTFDKYWSFVSSAYTDDTTDAGNSTSADTQVISGVGDIAYFGKSDKFDAISYDLSTNGTSGMVVWEYWNGSSWVAINDFLATANSTFGGDGYITFIPNSDWVTTTVNGEATAYYYIRARVTTAYSVAPVGVQAAAIPQINWVSAVSLSTTALRFIWTETPTTTVTNEGGNAPRVRYSSITLNSNPSDSASLGGHVLGNYTTDNTPTLTFTLSDTDSADTVKYRIQIDDSPDFSSPVVDYTSALAAQGSKEFTVGQAAGSGSYTTGSSGQTLSDGNYYWRVKTIDDDSAESSYSTANSGSIAFKVDVTPPTSFDLDSPGDSSYISSDRPTFKWKASSDATSGLSKYKLDIDNGSLGDFTIDNIPVSGTALSETSKYVIQFDNFSDSDSNNNYISVYTKSSNDWSSAENYGMLKEGQDSWKVTAFDNAGNTREQSRTIYLDQTGPSLSNVSALQNNLRPTIKGDASDNLALNKVEASYFKQNYILGIFSSENLEALGTYSFTGGTSQSFSFSPTQDLSEGEYKVLVKGFDKAGNSSSTSIISLTLGEGIIKTVALAPENKLQPVTTGQETSESAPVISIESLEKKATIKKEQEAQQLNSFISQASKTFNNIKGVVTNTFNFGRKTVFNIRNRTTLAFRNVSKKANQFFYTANKNLANLFRFNRPDDRVKGVSIAAGKESNPPAFLQGFFDLLDNQYQLLANIIFNQVDVLAQAYSSMAIGAPGVLRDMMLVFSGGVSDTSQFLAQLNSNLQEEINGNKAKISKSALAASGQTNSSINNLYQGMFGIADQISIGVNQADKQLMVSMSNAKASVETKKNYESSAESLSESGLFALNAIEKPLNDSNGFLGRTRVWMLTFGDIVLDPEPTKIAKVTIEEIGKDYAVISWKTNHYAWGKINYGEDLSYGKEIIIDERRKDHKVKLVGLKPGKRIFFEVMSQGKNYVFDAYYSFETKK